MPNESIFTKHLDYLQRINMVPLSLSINMKMTSALPDLRRLWHIKGVGLFDKQSAQGSEQDVRLFSEDALTGLYGYKIHLAFLIRGEPEGVAIHIGTWSPSGGENASTATLDARQEILITILKSFYPAIELDPADAKLDRSPLSGMVLGIPTIKPPDPYDSSLPLDRLIRAMSGKVWACLVLAQPVDEGGISNMRNSVINEIRSVQASAGSEMAPSPLAEYYGELLKKYLEALTLGQAVGAWRTCVYLLGDKKSYYLLSSVWRAIFSGKSSLPEPVHIWDNTGIADLAVNWSMPDDPGAPGPGQYNHPLQYQTILTSSQLAAYVHLPQQETSGFKISIVPSFDALPSPKSKGDRIVGLGKVIIRTQITQTPYAINLQDLKKHVFVAGVTGMGKTNTIFHMLKQADALGKPFLVIEPAKTEYRSLLADPNLAKKLLIFTLGNELVSPFRLNPFEVLPGIAVGVHLDLLRSVFSASFGMWTPLPQILEQCLHEIYKDRGWDITTNTNPRVDSKSDVSASFPTLSDLASKVDEVTKKLGYEEKITSDMRAALLTRINGLRTGGKGRMLDSQRSLPMEILLEHPTILELEGLGDDDDKAFIIGLLFVRLVEYRRVHGQVDDLQHLLVIEEAHRLLANVEGRAREEEANPRGKAVETFSNLLSEIRAYGQGVIVSDQVPVKLAPDVIKNTNLKIAHRIVAADDRLALGGSMVMDELQNRALARLTKGQAAVYSEGDDSPVLIQVPKAKDVSFLFSWDEIPGNDNKRLIEFLTHKFGIDWVKTAIIEKIDNGKTIRLTEGNNFLSLKLNHEQTNVKLEINDSRTDNIIAKIEDGKLNIYDDSGSPDNNEVARHMTSSRALAPFRTLFHPLSDHVDMSDPGTTLACDAARALVDEPTFRRDFVRLITSVTENDGALVGLWSGLMAHEQTVRRRGMDESIMRRCLIIYASEWFAKRRGSQAGWTYSETSELENGLRQMLFAMLEDKDGSQALKSFRECVQRLHSRAFEPYPGCEKICTQKPPVCLYRYAVEDYIAASDVDLKTLWDESYLDDKSIGDGLTSTWEICNDSARELIDLDLAQHETIIRICLCYAQHMLVRRIPETHDYILNELLNKADKINAGGGKNE